MNADWQSCREKLNHDILCNQVRNEVVTLRQDLTFKTHRLELWPQHAEAYRNLFENAATALSPQKLIELRCFDCWPQEYKDYFGDLFHAIFLLETEVEKEVEDLSSIFETALSEIKSFIAMPPEERTQESVLKLQQMLEALSVAISALPMPYLK